MTPLAQKLANRIAQSGPIGVDTYMQACLADPEHGYYTGNARPDGGPIGRGGDFITAPETSQMFGELIGLWCADHWLTHYSGQPMRLVELGPGRGTLMADALRAIGKSIKRLDLDLVETSPKLREIQATALAGSNPNWHGELASVPAGPALIIANEFFDALPIRQFVRSQSEAVVQWRERLVDFDEASGKFTFCLGQARPQKTLTNSRFANSRHGEVFEICEPGRTIASEIGLRIAKNGGAALIIDYGYGAIPGRPATGDTFQAVVKHAYTDPLAAPGEADLTAHVDFSGLANAATQGSGKLLAWGPINQGIFLKRLGIDARAETLNRGATETEQTDIAAALDRLIGATEMGNLFKVMALCETNEGNDVPAGFAMEDKFAS